MAVSASFVRLKREELKDLAAAAEGDDPQGLADFLAANGTQVVEFEGNAEIFEALLPILAEDYDIDLETSENAIIADLAEASEALVFILTPEEQRKYLDDLDPERFEVEALNEAYEDFMEEEADQAGEAMQMAIGAIHQALQEVDSDHVVVVTVG